MVEFSLTARTRIKYGAGSSPLPEGADRGIIRAFHPHPRIEYGAGSSPLPKGEGVSFDKLRTNDLLVCLPL